MTADYVDVGSGVSLFCRHAGEPNGRPPLVLLHGNRDNHAHYAELERILSASWHTVAIDFRGHGLSSKPDGPMTVDVLVDDVRAVLDHYGWERVHLAGHSLGSVTAMTLASQAPERVDRLILLGAAASFRLKFKRPPLPKTEEAFADMLVEANRRAAPVFFHESHPEVRKRVTACWSTMQLKVHRNLVALEHPDLRPVVPSLGMPTLVVAGEDDRCTTVEQARWIHDHLPDSELFVVPGTGHFMYMEQAAAVAARIEGFLRA